MRQFNIRVKLPKRTRKDVAVIVPIGDVHVGSAGCSKSTLMEDIETRRRKQLRKVEVEFASADLRDRFAIEGMISPRKHNHALNFMYSGRIEELIRVLAGQEVADLLVEEPTLEEIFMHYYDDEEAPDSEEGGAVQ